MFFSANDLKEFAERNGGSEVQGNVRSMLSLPREARLNKRHFASYVREVKRAILARQYRIGGEHYIGKWYRPWDVVPAVRDFRAPEGDYAVGVEIELGFTSLSAAQSVAAHLEHWKHVALDYEGGTYPIEATFPPSLYSKFGSKSQPVRYLKWLADNPHLVHQHREDSWVGTHINVSNSGNRGVNTARLAQLTEIMMGLSRDYKRKYFGRSVPYRYARTDDGKYIEFKMFNSTTDWKQLRRYVDVSVALAELAYGSGPINDATVRAALDKGYNKRNKAAKVSSPQVQSSQALAA